MGAPLGFFEAGTRFFQFALKENISFLLQTTRNGGRAIEMKAFDVRFATWMQWD